MPRHEPPGEGGHVGLLTGFVTIGLVIAVGALLAHLRVVGESTQRELLSKENGGIWQLQSEEI